MLNHILSQSMLKEKTSIKKAVINSIFITFFCHIFCCVFPMLAVVLGINFFGSIFHIYEPIFIGINIFSITLGFYFTYLHKETKKCDHKHCYDRSKIAYWIASILSIGLMIFSHKF